MIAIVTDSSAYLTRREAKAWGIVYVPLLYTIHSKEYAEKFADENQDITPVIRSGEAGHTSQAPQDSFLKVFRKLREQGYEVLCITMSSRLSGMYNNAWVCAQSLEDEGIEVVDSLATAGQLKLLLEQAHWAICQGMDLHQAANHVRALRSRVHTVFSVDDMAPLRRSGRLGAVKLSVSTILNIKPILRLREGTIRAIGTAQGTRERVRKILKEVPADAEKLVLSVYGHSLLDGALREGLQAHCNCPMEEMRLGPVLGIHLGDSAIGVAWLAKEIAE